MNQIPLDLFDVTELQKKKEKKHHDITYFNFYILCDSSLGIYYTVIGAENFHHASNKATKLFGNKWTGITRTKPSPHNCEYMSLVSFGELVRELRN